ncbi:hypothetical protein [Streptomyces sp. NPDC004232]|uniref:hypothetical protein n=1 Tax=unclassified Streptomyces TaxID=2593676 RepID=UPI001D574C4A|nr:hypothetical protein [Streptomyces sp. tea 10]
MRRILGTRAAALTLASAALLGGLVAAPDASATDWGGCRAWEPVAAGVTLSPCAYPTIDGRLNGWTYVSDPAGLNIDVCAQVLRVNPDGSTTEVADLHCAGWNKQPWAFQPGYLSIAPGKYVVQAGFWATINGHYGYQGFVQSPRVDIP